MKPVLQGLMWVGAAGMLSVLACASAFGIIEFVTAPVKSRDCLVHPRSHAIGSGELLVVEGKLYVCGYHPNKRPFDYLCEPMQRWTCP